MGVVKLLAICVARDAEPFAVLGFLLASRAARRVPGPLVPGHVHARHGLIFSLDCFYPL